MVRYIKIEINDGAGRTHSFVVDGERHQATIMALLGSVSVSRHEWDRQEQQRKRMREEARRRAREQEEYRARQQNSYWANPQYDSHQFFHDFFRDNPSFFQTYGGRDDGFRDGPSAGSRPKPPKTKGRKEQLADMAGVDWGVAELMEVKALLKKAQRKCHPDTGGSHEKWLDLQKLQQEMGI